jgi:hypothetical protein
MAGQIAGLVCDIKPAAEIIDTILAEAKKRFAEGNQWAQ